MADSLRSMTTMEKQISDILDKLTTHLLQIQQPMQESLLETR